MQKSRLFDIHTHLQFAAYDNDRDEVMKRTKDCGISVLNVGVDMKSSKDALELAKQYELEGVFASVGYHPLNIVRQHDLEEKGEAYFEEFDRDNFVTLAQDRGFSMIGECGLDYFRVTDETLRKK